MASTDAVGTIEPAASTGKELKNRLDENKGPDQPPGSVLVSEYLVHLFPLFFKRKRKNQKNSKGETSFHPIRVQYMQTKSPITSASRVAFESIPAGSILPFVC